METTRVQTVLRLSPELMARVKREARRQNKSFNSYVEEILDRETATAFPVLPPDYEVSDEIRNLAFCKLAAPSEEELAGDPKLAYLWEKYGRK